MKHLIATLAVIMTMMSSQTAFAGRISTLEVPLTPQITVDPAKIAPYLEKYKGYDGVMLSSEVYIEHSGSKGSVFSKTWKYSYILKREYIVINPQATYLTTYSLGYKYKKVYFQIVYPDGEAKLYSFDDLVVTKNAYNVKEYHLAFPNVTPGTVITIGIQDEYSIKDFYPPLEEDFDLQFGIPCEKLNVSFIYPEWWQVNIKRIGINEGIPLSSVTDTNEHKTILSYSAENVAAVRHEPFAPPFRETAKYMNLMVTHLKMMGVTFDQGESWDKFSETFRKYILKKADKRSKKMETIVDSLINPTDPPMTKVNTILSFIHKSIELSDTDNDGNPGRTLDLKKGSYSDITGLALSMLTYAGFDGDYIIVHDANDGYFDQMYVSFSQLSMPALRLRIDNRYITLFPSFRYLPAPIVPSRYQGQDAIIISEDTDFRFWRVSNDSTSSSKYSDVFTVHIDSSANVGILRKESIEGVAAYFTRREFEDWTETEREDTLRERVNYEGLDFTVNSVQMTNDTVYQAPLEIVYDISIRNAVTKTPTEMIIQTADLFPFGDNDLLAEAEQRTNPVYIPYNVTYERKFIFVFPNNWTLSDIPVPETFETELGMLTSQWEVIPEGVQVQQIVTLKQTKQPKEKYTDLLSLMGRNGKTTIPALVLSKTE